MASTTTTPTLEQFLNSLYNKLDTELFMKKFSQYSTNGDRYGMIEMIMQVEQVSKLKIKSSFNDKDNCKAQQLYNDIELNQDGTGKINQIDELTKALFAASVDTSLFFEIIIMRIRHWFTIGLYIRCCKDCDYAIGSLNKLTELNVELKNSQKYQTICVTMKNQCTKLLNKNKLKELNIDNVIKIPRVDGMLNKKLISCSDAVSFAFKEERGRHLIATRNIKAGKVLIVDKPFVFSTDKQALLTNCLHCHVSFDLDRNIKIPCNNCQAVGFCSEKCCNDAWDNYHRYECTIFGNFMENQSHSQIINSSSHHLLAYRTTIAKAIDKKLNTLDLEFLYYQDVKCDDEKKSPTINMDIDSYDPLDYRTVYSLETHCEKSLPEINLARSIKSVYLAKCLIYALTEIQPIQKIESREIILLAVAMMRHMQAITCNAYEIVENFRNEMTKTWEPRNVGGAIYTSVSMVNHSCYPNIVRHTYPGGIVVVRSIRFIGKGTEILDCYGPHFMSDPLKKRQQHLNEIYKFICTCEACTADWKFPFSNQINFRCNFCGCPVDSIQSQCSSCLRKIDIKKLNNQLTKSMKKRIGAIAKMYEGYYFDALPLLLEHNELIDRIVIAPSLEAIKTQQSIIQCYNSMGNVTKNCSNLTVI